jgi:hypothetical protein
MIFSSEYIIAVGLSDLYSGDVKIWEYLDHNKNERILTS